MSAITDLNLLAAQQTMNHLHDQIKSLGYEMERRSGVIRQQQQMIERLKPISCPAGAIDVRKVGVVCDGIVDDYVALQAAIEKHISHENAPRTLWFPGFARVTQGLRCYQANGDPGAYLIFQGESPDRSGIILDNPMYHGAVLYTCSEKKGAVDPKNQQRGFGNAAFLNAVYRMRVDASSSPNATALSFQGSNKACIADSLFIAGPGGVALDTDRLSNGPLQIRNTECMGKLKVGGENYGITLTNVIASSIEGSGLNQMSVRGVSPLSMANFMYADETDPWPTPMWPTWAGEIDPTHNLEDRTWVIGDQDVVIRRWNARSQVATPPTGTDSQGWRILHKGRGTLWIEDVMLGAGPIYKALPGAGPVFGRNIYTTGGHYEFDKQLVYLEAFNAEHHKGGNTRTPVVTCNNTDFYCLGFKGEGPATPWLEAKGGRTFFTGVFHVNVPTHNPMFVLQGHGGGDARIDACVVQNNHNYYKRPYIFHNGAAVEPWQGVGRKRFTWRA